MLIAEFPIASTGVVKSLHRLEQNMYVYHGSLEFQWLLRLPLLCDEMSQTHTTC